MINTFNKSGTKENRINTLLTEIIKPVAVSDIRRRCKDSDINGSNVIDVVDDTTSKLRDALQSILDSK